VRVKRRSIYVPGADAEFLEIGEDCTALGQAGYVIEKISVPFEDNSERKMVEVTLMERAKP
jgi:hypothetical protein